MNKQSAGLFCLLLLVCAGCDTINHAQYQVLGPVSVTGTRAVISSQDRENVKEILQAAAARLHYEDRLQQSLTPNTIASYAEPDSENPISFMAWAKDPVIIIDIIHKPTQLGESSAYQKVLNTLLSDLKEKFGDRIVISPHENQASSKTIFTQ